MYVGRRHGELLRSADGTDAMRVCVYTRARARVALVPHYLCKFAAAPN